ncbi:Transcription-associated protein 1 [Ceratocystis lukuohia]|uniref:Transcription-associated protein 1 n=1 Tax=Ceratocystis lukuohia TaxID=2019550 RepID=A0ABR4MMM0_9PEZI
MTGIEESITRLNNSDLDYKTRLEAASGIREAIDHYANSPHLSRLLQTLLPVFSNVLRGPPNFQSGSIEQRLRHTVLDTLTRLPNGSASIEGLETLLNQTIDDLMAQIRVDNEENAILCVKIVADIMRNPAKIAQTKVQPFLSLIQEIFNQIGTIVREQLDNSPATGSTNAPPATVNTQASFQSPRPDSPASSVNDLGPDPQQQNRLLVKGMQSFKVLSECPIIVVAIFSTYRQIVPANVKTFIPAIKAVLNQEAAAQHQAHAQAAAKGQIFTGVSPAIKNRAAFGDLIGAQAKTLTFLVFLFRQYHKDMADVIKTLPTIIVRLLRDCPREKSGTRKELLIALRHMIHFNFHAFFLPQINDLLDEETLIGDGLAVHETNRPLAYSMLADLIHNVREQLKPDQIRKAVSVYTKNLQNPFPGTSFQSMSARLLINMVDSIAKMENKEDARYYLMVIMEAFADKFADMNHQYPNAVKRSRALANAPQEIVENHLADKENVPEWDEVDIFSAMPIRPAGPLDRTGDPVHENKFLFQTMMHGLKRIFYQLRICNPTTPAVDITNAPPNWQEFTCGFSPEEVGIMIKTFRQGAQVFKYYDVDSPQQQETQFSSTAEYMANTYMSSSSKEEKELIESFATLFHAVDPSTFHEIFQEEIPHLYELIFDHPALLHIPQFFLASEATSPSFCGMLLRFLMDRIGEVGTADIKKSSVLLRLFKLAFMAVTLFANQNEPILQPHVVDIVTKSIDLSTKAEEPMNYFLLLRSLFRSIGGGKFEHLYKQILPLLEMLLEVLNNLLLAARRLPERDLYVELCLTVPARLSNLLPYLSFLMRPLVVALRSGPELVSQGLRTLELCVDNLTADYLDPILLPVMDDLMTALFDHLRPHPYPHFHSHTTMRILGKLGGRNRKSMVLRNPLKFETFASDPASFDVRLVGSKKDRAFPVELGVDLAIEKLTELPRTNNKSTASSSKGQSEGHYKRLALKFIIAQIKLRIGLENLPDDFPRLLRLQAYDMTQNADQFNFASFAVPDRDRSIAKRDGQNKMLQKLLKAIMSAMAFPELKDDAQAFLLNICRHFTIAEFGRALVDAKRIKALFDPKAGEGPLYIDNRVLADAAVEALASDHPDVREAGKMAIREVYSAATIILGTEKDVSMVPFFGYLSSVLMHSCYEEEWFTKNGGTVGIRFLLTELDLGDSWLTPKQTIEFIRALMYVVKDMPQDLPEKTRSSAQIALDILLQRITKDIKKEDVLPIRAAAAPSQPPTPALGQPPAVNQPGQTQGQGQGQGQPQSQQAQPKLPRQQSKMFQICAHFNADLSHMNRHVRETAKKLLELIAKAADCEVWDLVEPQKERLLQTVYAKPLRALPFATQIGYIDAVTYHMNLNRQWVVFDEPLMRLLMESLALADAPDDSLANKFSEYRTRENIVNLRVSCLKLLSSAMSFEEFAKASTNNSTRTKIVTTFFKCLYSDNAKTIEAGSEALRAVLTPTQKLPKELLQSGLRPVLANLQDPKKLTPHCLENLARLLMLLTSYFKVEIGSRLLDHVKTLADSLTINKLSFTLFEQSPAIKVISLLFNIFHLLPPEAGRFKEKLVETFLDLESGLRRTRSTPFREPVYKYFNTYPKDLWALCLAKLEDQRYGILFSQALTNSACEKLQDMANNDIDALLKRSNDVISQNKDTKFVVMVNALYILEALSSSPGAASWLKRPEVTTWVRNAAAQMEQGLGNKSAQIPANLRLPSHLRIPAARASQAAITVLLNSLKHMPRNLDPLFTVIDAMMMKVLPSSPRLIHHIYHSIVCSDDVEFWRETVLKCLDAYSTKAVSQRTKKFVLHNIVNPIFAMDVMKNWGPTKPRTEKSLLDSSVMEAINTKIWKVHPDTASDDSSPEIDHTRLEILQLSALLIKYHHEDFQDSRKEIIKFGWTFIRLDDVVIKHAAYVVIAYFIALYETPPKIIMQIYCSLLRLKDNEGRALVFQGLDLIAPVLPKYCGNPAQDRTVQWAIAPRRVLLDEGHSNGQQMQNIFHFLVKHPDLFYEAREKYAVAIISSIRKVIPNAGSSSESRKLALNMMWLIWEWEKRRVEGLSGDAPTKSPTASPVSRKRKLEDTESGAIDSPAMRAVTPAVSSASAAPTVLGGSAPASASATPRPEFQIPPAFRLRMIKQLVEFIAQLNGERYPVTSAKAKEPMPTSLAHGHPDLCRRAFALLFNLLQPKYWGDLELDLFGNVPELLLTSDKAAAVLSADINDKEVKIDEKVLCGIVNMLQVLRIVVNSQTDEWVLRHLPQLLKLLDRSLKSENPEVQDCLHGADAKCDEGREIKPLMLRLLEVSPEDVAMEDADVDGDAEAPMSETVSGLCNLATEAMAGGNYMAGVNLLWSLGQWKKSTIDNHIPALMKALQSRLAREHVQHYQSIANHQANVTANNSANNGANSTNASSAEEMTPHRLELQTRLMLKAIHTVALRMEILHDHRRPFLSVLATLVEKSQHMELCEAILAMVETWVFRSDGIWPTLKERTAVLHKMLAFEQRADPTLLNRFLELVLRIYEDPRIAHTELTVRMEQAFLVGTRAQDASLRDRFMAIFDKSLSKTAATRLAYVISGQSWDSLADSFWLSQASQLLLASIESHHSIQLQSEDFRTLSITLLLSTHASGDPQREPGMMPDDRYNNFMANHRAFVSELSDVKVRDILDPLVQLQHTDPNVSHQLWVRLYPLFWSVVSRDDRAELQKALVVLLTKEYHSRQLDRRPNVVQSLVDGAAKAWPECKLPPHVLKFVARTYGSWYTALIQMEQAAIKPESESATVRESNLDALTELYAGLQEDDLFYGAWRRRCQFVETNAALSYQQSGLWDKAQKMYEAAQIRARTGVIPYQPAEYMLWEDEWVRCAMKLQQWEILQEYAKHENFQDLLLECAWRATDMWQASEHREALENILKGIMDAPTPRRMYFQSFMTLLKLHHDSITIQASNTHAAPPPSQQSAQANQANGQAAPPTPAPQPSQPQPLPIMTSTDFSKVCDESIQLTIRKWHQLPNSFTGAHISLLHNFQLLVELHDASVICQSLVATSQANLDVKSGELKLLLGAWRDRLPNPWDDIQSWQELVSWRQHIFVLINQTYLQLAPQNPPNTSNTSYAYRGYHETAWIINRFAHVSRKHGLSDVCINQLSRIYTLPNIEIQEAFLKLREQAKCHFENPEELKAGLEVINNTNLNYFTPPQKAEFYTLKGMFLERLSEKEEADQAYGTALWFDITAAKAWAEWGRFHDAKFKAEPTNLGLGRLALISYLHAAASFKNAKSRKLVARILWLLSLDDAKGQISGGFEEYKSDIPVWYWITFIPQLLGGLYHKEAPRLQPILIKIAKSYPQALYFHLRTIRDDVMTLRKNHEQRLARLRAQQAQQNNGAAPNPADLTEPGKRHVWEYLDELVAVLKTAFPLLALSMETMVDQIQKQFKCPLDEDAYRLIVALLNDGLAYVSRMPHSFGKDVKLPAATETNITRFADTILPPHIKASFEEDFVKVKPTMYEYIQRLRTWRNKFEEKLDRRVLTVPLESFSPHLSEFSYQKFDDVEMPGQYLQHKDKNQDFIRIQRFLPNVDLIRGVSASYRRLKIRGHDGSVHSWAVQHPAARHCRREEKTCQLFRGLNETLAAKKETRRRDLKFTLPWMVPLAAHLRMVHEDVSYISLQAVFDSYCKRNGIPKDKPILVMIERLHALLDAKNGKPAQSGDQNIQARYQVFTAIQDELVPQHVVLDYFHAIYADYEQFFLFRKQFSYQLASLSFMTYILSMHNRQPQKMHISRATGNIWGSDLIPYVSSSKPFFHNPEPVPFRLTPNLQILMGPLATEGIFTASMLSIARSLTEPAGSDLEHSLALFVRDEIIHWFTSHQRQPAGSAGASGAGPGQPQMTENQLRESVQLNSDAIVKRAAALACQSVGSLPATQSVIDLVAKAVNPMHLAMSDALWMAYL